MRGQKAEDEIDGDLLQHGLRDPQKSKVIPRDSKTKVAEASCVADFSLQWKGSSALATVLAIMNEGG